MQRSKNCPPQGCQECEQWLGQTTAVGGIPLFLPPGNLSTETGLHVYYIITQKRDPSVVELKNFPCQQSHED